jgi:hypothetical protein
LINSRRLEKHNHKKKGEFQEPPRLWRRILELSKRPEYVPMLEWAAVCAIVLLATFLQIVLFQHEGSFWRDECNTIYIASRPTFSGMLALLPNDPFPPLFATILRLWITAGPGAGEASLHLFGAIVSVGLVFSILISFRLLSAKPPLLAISLIALNVSIFYYGSSIRAYGLSIILILLCYAFFWRLSREPSWRNGILAFLLAVASVHLIYQNSYLLFGIGIGAASVCAVCRQWKRMLLILMICLFAACSMLIYIPMVKTYWEVNKVLLYPLPLQLIAGKLGDSISGASVALLGVWGVLLTIAVVCLIAQYVGRLRLDTKIREPSLPLYSLIVLAVGGTASFVFMKISGVMPNPWHFTPLIAVAGVVVETAIRSARNAAWISWFRLLAASMIVALSIQLLWHSAHLRRTNVDLIGQTLAREAAKNDLILVSPFWLSPGFSFHYRGECQWNTLPLIPVENRPTIYCYFSAQELMATPDALESTLALIRITLSTGHRIWIVGGGLQFLPEGATPPYLPPAPQSPYGWDHNAYVQLWAMQTGYFIQTHARSVKEVPVPVNDPVSQYENLPLILIEGWNISQAR